MNLTSWSKGMGPALLYFVVLPLLGLAFLLFIGFTKVRAEVKMCQAYYSELSTWDCYWSPKVLPQRSSK